MTDKSEEASSSTPSTVQNVASTSTSSTIGGGFYARFSAGKNFETPTKPSFLEDSSKTLDGVLSSASKKHDFSPSATLYSVPTSSSVMSTSIFGSAKRKRPNEVVSKPSFKVSDFIGASPHLPKFGTSLTKVKFDLSSFNQSKFYSGRTKFGGSSSFREESSSAKRIKISPVSYRGPTNLTRVSAKPYCSENKRTITSKTAENILNTLNKICTPVKPPEKQPFHSEFSSFSQRLREKRKAGMSSLPPPPIAKLNRVKSAHVTNTKIDEDISIRTTEVKSSENGTVISPESIATKPSEKPPSLPSEIETDVSISEPMKISESVTVNATEVETEKSPEVQLVDNSDTMTVHVQAPFASIPIKLNENGISKVNDNIPKVDAQATIVSKNGLKMKRQRTKDHYTASEKVEEPVNTMPEITAVEPLVVSTLPKFELSVKPAAAPIFTPISKLPKPVDILKNIPINNDQKFGFSSPKVISDKSTESISSDAEFSFIAPVYIKNPGTPIVSKTKSKLIGEQKNGVYPKEILGSKPSEVIITKKNTAEEIPSVAIMGNKEAPLTFGFKIPKKEEGSWECPTCMITNKADCMKCIACTEPKPGSVGLTSKTEPLFSFGQPTSTISGFSFGKTTVSSSTFSFASTNTVSSTGFTFSKPFSTICSPELTLGKTTDVTCNNSSELKVESTSEGNRSFTFPMPIPASLKSDSSVISSVSNEAVKSNPLLKFKQPEGSWECPTCMISNKSDALKCVSCTEPKPGSKATEIACGPTAVGGKPEFKFGSADSKPEFKFGSADSKTEFKFGSADSKTEFKFGGSTNGKADFKFGDTTSSKVEFKFGAPANSTSSNFSFGVTTSSTNAAASSNASISFEKPSDSKNVENPFLKFKPNEGSWECPTCMISNKPDVLKCVACTEPKPGAPPAIETEVSKPSLFGASNSSSFTFGTASKTSSSGGFSFQKIAAEGQDNPKSASSIEISQPTESMFSFGKPSVESGGSSGFSFAAVSSVASSAPTGFSFPPSVPSLSTTSTGGLASSSQFSFVNASNSGSGFSFGNPNAFGSANAVGFTFGSGISKETKDAEVKPMANIFGNQADKKLMNGPSSSEQPAPTGFSFGVASNVEKSVISSNSNIFSSVPSFDSSKVNGIPATTEMSAPQFNFSSNTKPSFLVNSNDTKPTEPSVKFNFNPGSMSTPNFNFGAASSAAAIFGNPSANGQFNFAGNPSANNETPKANIFASPSASSNLFHIGGGGSNDTNSTTERRKVKRAHRRLPRK